MYNHVCSLLSISRNQRREGLIHLKWPTYTKDSVQFPAKIRQLIEAMLFRDIFKQYHASVLPCHVSTGQ